MGAPRVMTASVWNVKMNVPVRGLTGRRVVQHVAEMGHRVGRSQRIQMPQRDVMNLLLPF